MSCITEVTSHMLGRIKAAELVRDPFPYMFISDLFPADYYAKSA